ncbi:MAG: hypothetical protein IKI46_07020 [Lachnospiraceae bacterium]|nr:hypothetical protein [Lachnospiraceae bacterium]
MKRIKSLTAVLMMVSMLVILTGCEKPSIAGYWELRETQWGDGYYRTWESFADDGIYISYEFDDLHSGTYYYTTPEEEIVYEFQYSRDDKGHFWIDDGGSVCFHVATMKGDTFTYVEGEGDDAVTYVFDRVDE